ncbi:hypothetical protein ABH926_000420 [Catenulispora sp. GP43]|uniref:hypothetical protein n=1 Tax=Catenulispora sp. GP43 TaxID=3156263 RepID=UPI0035111ED6
MTTDLTGRMDAFMAALRAAEASLREVPGKLEGARVHDFAFGKMFEATEVRDAYHKRLPETEKDIAEACEVLEHFIAGLDGGRAIGTNPDGPDPDRPDSALSQVSEWTADSFPWRRRIPLQTEGGAS